jgi:segregation and condensation protein B
MTPFDKDRPGAGQGRHPAQHSARGPHDPARHDPSRGVHAPHPIPLPSNVARLPSADRREKLRILEALLFAAAEPLDEASLAVHFGKDDDLGALLEELQGLYAGRGVNLIRLAGKWAFRTAEDLSYLLERYSVEPKKLSRAALETLAIIGYHQPVTRAEIEEIRGVSTSKGTLDVLLEVGWVRLRGRRRAPGRPVTYGTTQGFLEHFGFDSIKDLPGLNELKGAGLLDSNLPPGFTIPEPTDSMALAHDEDPLEENEPIEDLETDEAEEELEIDSEDNSSRGDDRNTLGNDPDSHEIIKREARG